MNDTSQPKQEPLTMEEGFRLFASQTKRCIRQRHEQCEQRIRKSPTTALLGAVAAGYLLHRLPVRAILITQIRILSSLTPPALFLFGAAKIHDYLQTREWAKRE